VGGRERKRERERERREGERERHTHTHKAVGVFRDLEALEGDAPLLVHLEQLRLSFRKGYVRHIATERLCGDGNHDTG